MYTHLSALRPHPDNGSPKSSKYQPECTAIHHDHAIDYLIRKIAALSLHDHAFPQKSEALTLDNHALDALQQSKALALDGDHVIDDLIRKMATLSLHDLAIDALLQQSKVLTFGGNHTLDVLPQKSEALTFDKNSAINALALDNNHAVATLLHKSEALALDSNHAINTLLHKSDAHILGDDASMLHNRPNDSPSHQHLRRNTAITLPQDIEAINPRNFNYDSPYTTMLSTPYFETWNLLFSTMVPHSHPNVNHITPH
ncbi:hypothetical protein BDR04DRAFT_812512 [Suillus decipiens]|nr:hypothetical protein BDR04DRAFT_812512 [Suillus decipiens]